MLSKVAERMYWFGRYIERAENTARMVSVNNNLLLDLPRLVKNMWADLINISGYSNEFYARFGKADERNVIKFILADSNNPGSILNSINMARENARTTREILPTEAWELVNELYLYVRRNVERAVNRQGRHIFLKNVTTRSIQMTGLLIGGMTHSDAYNFISIGRNLERADMTTRIVDVGCMNLIQPNEDIPDAFDNTLWMSVLRSLSAYQMYRQHVRDRVNGEDVIGFLLRDPQFPRSTLHCIAELGNRVEKLPRNDLPLRSITHMQRKLVELDVATQLGKGLHEYIDELQVELAEIHNQVARTWFAAQIENMEPATQTQTQTQTTA
jgi:uncharacterized alpha-E superfamily protein